MTCRIPCPYKPGFMCEATPALIFSSRCIGCPALLSYFSPDHFSSSSDHLSPSLSSNHLEDADEVISSVRARVCARVCVRARVYIGEEGAGKQEDLKAEVLDREPVLAFSPDDRQSGWEDGHKTVA